MVRRLRDSGVTIILTTHYIAEAEEMADRIGIILKGELKLVEEKQALMQKLGKKELILELAEPMSALPTELAGRSIVLNRGGSELVYTYDSQDERSGIGRLVTDLGALGIAFKDLQTKESSLEDIFVNLVREGR